MANTSKAQIKATDKYQKANIQQVLLKINKKTEPELYCWLDMMENKQGYLKALIREDLKRHTHNYVVDPETGEERQID